MPRGRELGLAKAARMRREGKDIWEIAVKLQVERSVVVRWLAQKPPKGAERPKAAAVPLLPLVEPISPQPQPLPRPQAKALSSDSPWPPMLQPSKAQLMSGK